MLHLSSVQRALEVKFRDNQEYTDMRRPGNHPIRVREEKRPAIIRVTAATVLQSFLLLLIGLYIGIGISGVFEGQDYASSPSFGADNNSGGENKQGSKNETQLILERLKLSEEEAKRWKSEVETMRRSRDPSTKKIRQLEGSCNDAKHDTTTTNGSRLSKSVSRSSGDSAKTNQHPFCQSMFPRITPSTMALWNEYLLDIFEASRHPNDSRFFFHDFTAQLLQIISPRLSRSIKTVPFDWRPVENALTIAWKRYEYLQLPKEKRDAIPVEDRPRPLKMLIMGGSLLVGTNCRMMMKELNFQFRMPKKECTWSFRVGEFLNALVLGVDTPKKERRENVVDVTKVAMGGTNTATGSVIWQYDLIPNEAKNPDIILNAYSTNDMHILTVLEAQSSNTTLRDRTFEMMQDFVRKILDTNECTTTGAEGSIDKAIPPLLLHMDDYLGNEQRKIWETTELSQGVQVLANYYGFVSMSYADVVREFVYGDTYETWFSSEWWIQHKEAKDLLFDRQIHPNMGMHISAMWVTAYNLLHLASTYCSIPTLALVQQAKNTIDEYEPGLWGLPKLDFKFKQPDGKPHPLPRGIPPELTKDLLLEDVTLLWRQQAQSSKKSTSCQVDPTRKGGVTRRVKCPFSWVSGLSLQQNNVTWIKQYFQDQSSVWKGWDLSEDGGKIGFIPTTESSKDPDSRIVLDFLYPQEIQSITIFYMKSYGRKWENSELQAKVSSFPTRSSDPIILGDRNMQGTHNKQTSEMYTEEIVLNQPVDPDQKLQLEVKLVGGGTFKIMGLAVCS